MNPKVREDQVGQFSTGGVGHFYPGANSTGKAVDYKDARGIKPPTFLPRHGNNAEIFSEISAHNFELMLRLFMKFYKLGFVSVRLRP